MSDRGTPDATTGLRPSVHRFALVMEQKLQMNDHIKPHWRVTGISALYAHMVQEIQELLFELDSSVGTPGSIALEAADIACLAMMIADVAGGLKDGKATGATAS